MFQVREMIQNLNHTDAIASAEMTFQVSFLLGQKFYPQKNKDNYQIINIFKDLITVNHC